MSITRFNNENVKFDFEPSKNFEYKTLVELYKANKKDKVYEVKGLFINTKSKFGDSPVAVTEKFYVNLPSHMTNTVREIREDVGLIADINNGKIGFTIYEYEQKKYKKTCYSINWVDIN